MGLSREAVTPEEVLASIVLQLRTELALEERQLWVTADALIPISAIPPGGTEWATVSMGDIEFGFDQAEPENILAQTTVTVTGYLRFGLDDMGHDEGFLVDATRGAYRYLRRIIKALHGLELLTTGGLPWCAELPRVTGATKPDFSQQDMTGWVQARFAIAWDWLNDGD